MLEVLNLRQGSVVNHKSGREHEECLELPVEVMADSNAIVRVNGLAAIPFGQKFTASIALQSHFNDIEVEAINERGAFTQLFKVVWDKRSFPRYNFFIDDNIFLFHEIAKERPASLFDHFYLKFLKKMNSRYGMKVTLNCFYRNDHTPFELKDFPDIYRSEWRDNADWLRLSFHAYSEFPDRPYQNATPAKLLEDYRLIQQEIIRFAGEESFIEPIVLHWAMAQPEALTALSEIGVRVLEGQFINAQTHIGGQQSKEAVCDIGYFRNLNEAIYLNTYKLLHSFEHNLSFIQGSCTFNLLTREQIEERLSAVIRNPSYYEAISLATHEQYTYPYYSNYLPDHMERIELGLRLMTENGYKPVFFAEGFLGNPSWGK